MNKYVIEISERLAKQEIIEAETEQEAIEKAKNKYRNNSIVLSADDFVDVDYECIEVREEPKIKYETICILNTKTEIKNIKEITEFIKKEFEVTNIELIGERKLSYEIKGNKEGFYIRAEMNGTSENVAMLERYYRLDDNVLKFIVAKIGG